MKKVLNKSLLGIFAFVLCFLSIFVLCGCDNNSKIETNPTQEVATEIEVTYVETVVLLGEYRFGTGSMFSNSYSPKDNKILLNTKTQQVSFYALSTTYNRYVKYDFPIGACMIIYQKNENTD